MTAGKGSWARYCTNSCHKRRIKSKKRVRLCRGRHLEGLNAREERGLEGV